MEILVGVCDDVVDEQDKICDFCRTYLENNKVIYKFIKFNNAEDIISYAVEKNNKKIDLLFLDIKLSGMSGIKLKDILLKLDKVWRIAFFSSYLENMVEAYSIKTIGFIKKPVQMVDVYKILDVVLEEKKENIVISIADVNNIPIKIQLEDIIYLKADGNYTEIYTYSQMDKLQKYILCTKKIGLIEKELEQSSIIRVHKSYMVNLQNVDYIKTYIALNGIDVKIPIGRKYKEVVKIKNHNYGKEQMKRRL